MTFYKKKNFFIIYIYIMDYKKKYLKYKLKYLTAKKLYGGVKNLKTRQLLLDPPNEPVPHCQPRLSTPPGVPHLSPPPSPRLSTPPGSPHSQIYKHINYDESDDESDDEEIKGMNKPKIKPIGSIKKYIKKNPIGEKIKEFTRTPCEKIHRPGVKPHPYEKVNAINEEFKNEQSPASKHNRAAPTKVFDMLTLKNSLPDCK